MSPLPQSVALLDEPVVPLLFDNAPLAPLRDWLVHLDHADLAARVGLDCNKWRDIWRSQAADWPEDVQDVLVAEAGRILRMIAPEQRDGLDIGVADTPVNDTGWLGWALWLRVADPLRFALVEQVQAAEGGRLRDGARFSLRGEDTWHWDGARQAAFAADLTRALGLAEPCRVVETTRNGLQHLLLDADQRRIGAVLQPASRDLEVLGVDGSLGLIIARALSRAGLGRDDVRVHHPNLHPLLTLTEPYPRGDFWRIDRIRVLELSAAIGHTAHRLTLTLGVEADPLQVTRDALGIQHPFLSHHWLAGIRLEITVVDDRDMPHVDVLEIRSPHQHNLATLNPWVRRAAEQLLDRYAVFGRRMPSTQTEAVFRAALRLLEGEIDVIQGDTLARQELPIVRLEQLGLLQPCGWHDELDLNSGGEPFRVKVRRGAHQGEYDDPRTGERCQVPLYLLRCYRRNPLGLRRVLLEALGRDIEPAGANAGLLLGEMAIGERRVPVYLASRLWHADSLRDVSVALRARGDRVGIVLTTSSQPPAFLGAHVVLSIESLLLPGDGVAFDVARLKMEFRHGLALAQAGQIVALNRGLNGHVATLTVPGKPPFVVTGHKQMLILDRLVRAYQSGYMAVATKDLISNTSMSSPQQAFKPSSPWREYMEPVPGVKAWRLRVE